MNFEERRKNTRKKKPDKLTQHDIIEHRFWLNIIGVPVRDIDRYLVQFIKTFKEYPK